MKSRHVVAATLIAAVAALLGAGAAGIAPAAAQSAPLGVSGCVTIVAPGAYSLTADAATTNGDCIVIAAPNVSLDLGMHTISGGNDAQSAGVRLEPAAIGSSVGDGVVSGFGVGIEVDAPAANVHDVTVVNSILGGVQFDNAPGAALASSYITQQQGYAVHLANSDGAAVRTTRINGTPTYGIWIDGSNNAIVQDNDIHIYGAAAIYAGCVVDGQFLSATCPAERGIAIDGNTAVNNQGFGIVAGNNVQSSTITRNSAYSGGAYDLFDLNPGCGSNSWSGNSFRVANRSCIG